MSNNKKFAIIEIPESEIENSTLKELAKTTLKGTISGTGCTKTIKGEYVCSDEDRLS